MAAKSNLETLLTEHELAKLWKRSVKTIRKDRLLGQGPRYVKLGRSVRYRPQDVTAYLSACPSGGANLEESHAL